MLYVSLCMCPCEVGVKKEGVREEGGGRRERREEGEEDGGPAEKTRTPLRKWGIHIF